MKTLIAILIVVASFFTIGNLVATINDFPKPICKVSIEDSNQINVDDSNMMKGCFDASKRMATINSEDCKGNEIDFPKKETFVFMNEIYPNEPTNLFNTQPTEGFIFQGEYFEPMPREEEKILPPNINESALNFRGAQ